MPLPDASRRTQALVAECRRHLDVDHHGVRLVRGDLRQQDVGPSSGGNHLVPETLLSIADRAREQVWHARHPELAAQSGLPIKDIQDLTSRGDYWFACLPANGTPPEVLRGQLLKVHGVTIYVSVGLPRPLPAMIRTWTRTHQHEDLHASLTALENALASRQQRRLTVYD